MKIVMIHGQNHKGSTYHIGTMLAQALGGEVTEFFLPRDFHAACTGCNTCFLQSETRCPHYKELSSITRAMDEADVIILTSPVYVYHVTGAMKAFLDHYGYRWMIHRPNEKMFHKQAVCISTAAGGGTRSANRDMADSTFFWGVGKTHCYGALVRALTWAQVSDKRKERLQKDMCRLAEKIKHGQGKIRPCIKTKAYFTLFRFLQQKGLSEPDVAYWTEKGWLGKNRPWKLRDLEK